MAKRKNEKIEKDSNINIIPDEDIVKAVNSAETSEDIIMDPDDSSYVKKEKLQAQQENEKFRDEFLSRLEKIEDLLAEISIHAEPEPEPEPVEPELEKKKPNIWGGVTTVAEKVKDSNWLTGAIIYGLIALYAWYQKDGIKKHQNMRVVF